VSLFAIERELAEQAADLKGLVKLSAIVLCARQTARIIACETSRMSSLIVAHTDVLWALRDGLGMSKGTEVPNGGFFRLPYVNAF